MNFNVECISELASIKAEQWNHLVPQSNPFLRYEFLAGLETNECVGPPQTGWVPRHLLLRSNNGQIIAGMPLYEKYDSYGEYIFDWSWARAASTAGIPYYPKLVSAIPYTPSTGPRLLISPNSPIGKANTEEMLLKGLQELATKLNASSAHILFHPSHQQPTLNLFRFQHRMSYQFHWKAAPDWTCFEDYLSDMRSPYRKQIRRERKNAASHGLDLIMVPGFHLSDLQWNALWEFYQLTVATKGAIPYLTKSFFLHLRTTMKKHVVASFAQRNGIPVAGSLFFRSEKTLFGRYWGAKEFLDCLHFELCYYLPVEWALRNGITYFDAGAQGQHKLKRGFLPSICHSSHWIAHPNLAQAVYEFLPKEAHVNKNAVNYFTKHSPFKAKED